MTPLTCRLKVGLLKDEGWSQKQTWNCDCAVGLSARKGPQSPSVPWNMVYNSQKDCVLAERGLLQRLGWPRMVWTNGQGGGALEDEVLWAACSLLGKQ